MPVINSLKDKNIPFAALPVDTLKHLQSKMKLFVEDIFGLKGEEENGTGVLKGIMQVLIDMRKEARAKKDWATSDKIRNQLAEIGIAIKDEKDGSMSWSKV